MKRLLACAVYHEVEETIHRFDAKKIGDNLFTYSGGAIVVTGMGVHNAQAAVSEHLGGYDEVWNFGLAGGLDGSLPWCEVVEIGKVVKYVPIEDLDEHSKKIMDEHLQPIELSGKETLMTSDFPIHSKRHRQEGCHLVDMEGYGVAFAAKHLNRPCRMWKIVSDFCSEDGVAMIHNNKKKYSTLLADLIENESNCHT
ncbi:MAG: Futalosine hydrolase [Chlamydiales bacterium]|nr:Futalosine hydrolase [Chlamydiales bacterium]MCH9635199.1 Futalosine hydrolase [Chlamydiales bacterium]MCH9703977.1 hypothetical protein [Chlamydiota bacterium]